MGSKFLKELSKYKWNGEKEALRKEDERLRYGFAVEAGKIAELLRKIG